MLGTEPAGDLNSPTKAKLHRDLFGMENPVQIHAFSLVEAVDWPAVTLAEQGQTVMLDDLDSIVHTGFHRANDSLVNALDVEISVHTIGDAVAPWTIKEAIHEGERTARDL